MREWLLHVLPLSSELLRPAQTDTFLRPVMSAFDPYLSFSSPIELIALKILRLS